MRFRVVCDQATVWALDSRTAHARLTAGRADNDASAPRRTPVPGPVCHGPEQRREQEYPDLVQGGVPPPSRPGR